MYSENNYIMWLNSLLQINIKQRTKLYEHFGSAEAVWHANSREICHVSGIDSKDMYNIVLKQKNNEYMDSLISDAEKARSRFITRNDNEFPDLLKEIYDCPLGLYIIGQFPKEEPKISIVGSRNCTEYGSSVAYNISKELAKSGVVVVSGMAEGIDSYAHKGAIDGGGKTVAVMGTGIDVCYPRSNRALREKIIQNGCIISEYPPGTRGTAFTFPQRNRIISGLSKGVAVVEAAKRSGSLITVRHAIDQNRDVFVVPGNITSYSSVGCNTLIKEGAEPLLSADDILESYNIKKEVPKKAIIPDDSVTADEKTVFECIDLVPQSVEELAAKTGFETRTLQGILLTLELNGLIAKLSGQRYVRS